MFIVGMVIPFVVLLTRSAVTLPQEHADGHPPTALVAPPGALVTRGPGLGNALSKLSARLTRRVTIATGTPGAAAGPPAVSGREAMLRSDAAFEVLAQMVAADGGGLVERLGATVQFHVTKDSCGSSPDAGCDGVQRGWTLDLSGREGAGRLTRGFAADADLNMVADDGVMEDIAYGRMDPKMAVLRGKLRMYPLTRVPLALRFDEVVQGWRKQLLGYAKQYEGTAGAAA